MLLMKLLFYTAPAAKDIAMELFKAMCEKFALTAS